MSVGPKVETHYLQHSPSMSGKSETLKMPGMRFTWQCFGEGVRAIVFGWNVWDNDILGG